MVEQSANDFQELRTFQMSGSVNAAAGTVSLVMPLFMKGLIERIMVIRTVGDATNFGLEIRDDVSGSADDDNRWYYLASGARIKWDGIPDSKEYLNRDAGPLSVVYVLVPFSGGTAIVQTYQVTIWARKFR